MEYFIYFLISLAVSILLKPKLESQKPPSKDDLQFPTNDPTRNITVLFGTVRIKAVSHIWAGDNFKTERMTKKVGNFLSSQRVTLGFKTIISIAIMFGYGETRLRKIWFNDFLAWEADLGLNPFGIPTSTFNIDNETLFLKEEDEDLKTNGVSGVVDFYDGTQEEFNAHIQQVEGLNTLPPFKDLSYAVLQNFYFGNTRVLPKPEIELTRLPNNILLNDEHYILNSDGSYESNPVEILFDIMTESEMYGVNIDQKDIDVDSFRAAGTVLKNEGFGLSMVFESGSNFEDIKKDIEKHIAGNVFMSPYTGKWTITLNRDNYNVEDLFIYNKDNIKTIKYSRTQENTLFTEVKINYEDRSNEYKKNTAIAKTQSVLNIKGRPRVIKDDFLACKTATLANKIASRELLGYSKPLAKLELITNRENYGVKIGDVVVVNYDDYNLNNNVFRVIEVNLGQFNKGQIKINLMEDIFQFGNTFLTDNESTKWNRPTEQDYNFNYRLAEAPAIYGLTNNAICNVTNHSTRSIGFSLYIDEGTRILQEEVDYTTPNAIIKNSVDFLDTSIDILSAQSNTNFDLGVLEEETTSNRLNGANLCYITDGVNEEYISFSNITYDSINDKYILNNVWRGCLDTQPKQWSANAIIYFASYGSIVSDLDPSKTLGTVVTYDIDRTFSTKEDVVVVDNQSITFNNRHEKPLYPYNLKINGVVLGDTIPANTDLVLSWEGSNRLTNALNQTVTYFNNEGLTEEQNTVYNLRIYDDTDTLIKTENGLTSKTYTFTDEVSLGGYFNTLRIELESERDGIISHEIYNKTLTRI